jgi:hypothetical protein
MEPRANFDPLIQLKLGVRPPPTITLSVVRALDALRTAHRLAGSPLLTITDWYRDASTNLMVGGELDSLHLQGLAFDLRNDAAGFAVFKAWRSLGLQGVDERSTKNHFHIELQRG